MNKIKVLSALLILLTLSSCQMTTNNLNLTKLVNVGEGLFKQGDIDTEQEHIIGREMTAILLGAATLHPDQALQRYVNRVGRWVALHSERPQLPWTFAVIDTEDINAFAMPGGFVLVSSGLMKNLSSESELAAVLAHEVAHVARRHHVQEIERQNRVGLMGELASLSADYYQSSDNSRDRLRNRQLTEKLLNASHELYTKGLSKDDEFQADRDALVLTLRAGYDAYGLAAVLQTLNAIQPDDSHLALLFATHPEPASRLEQVGPLLEDLDRLGLYGQMVTQRYQMPKL